MDVNFEEIKSMHQYAQNVHDSNTDFTSKFKSTTTLFL